MLPREAGDPFKDFSRSQQGCTRATKDLRQPYTITESGSALGNFYFLAWINTFSLAVPVLLRTQGKPTSGRMGCILVTVGTRILSRTSSVSLDPGCPLG